MKEKERIEVRVKKWTKATISGNNKCPECKEDMLIIPSMCSTIAYCFKCKEYYFDVAQLNNFGKSMVNLDKYIKQMNIGND